MAGVTLHDELARDFKNGQRGQAQEVELHQANRFNVIFVVLTDRRIAAGLLVKRAKISQLAGRDQHTTGVHADVAGQAFKLACQLQQRAHVFFFAFAFGQNRLGLDRVNHLVVFVAVSRRQLQRNRLPGFVWNQLRNAVAKPIRKVQHTADVANRRSGRHGAEGDNLADGFFAVFGFDVVDHAVAIGLAKVNVEVGHRDPFRVQKPLKQQVVLQRVEVGDAQRISHQRTGARTPPRPDWAAVVLGPVDEVAHNQKVTRKAHLQDHVDLKIQPRLVLGPLAFAQIFVRVQMQEALFQAFMRGMAKVSVNRQAHTVHFGRRVVGQHRLAEVEHQIAALGDFNRIGQCRRNIGKQRGHLRLRLEVLLARELAHAPGVAQDLTLRNTHARFMRLVVVIGQKLHRMRRHHGQLEPRRQLHGSHHMALVISTFSALQFQVKTVRKKAGKIQGTFHRAGLVALHQGLTHSASLGARQRNQAFAQLFQPVKLNDGLVAHHVFSPSAGQQLRQIQVAAAVLHQQQQPGGWRVGGFAGHLDPDVRTDQGFDALAARLLVELDRAKEIRQVGDGQCWLLVGRCGGHNFIDPVGAVDDGELGMNTQMNKHGNHFRRHFAHLKGLLKIDFLVFSYNLADHDHPEYCGLRML